MLKSILSNWVSLLVEGLMALFITPFMIHRLGDFQFGIYTLAFSTIGYFDLLSQGIRFTLQRYVGRLSGTQDRESLNSVFSTALAVTLAVGAIVVGLFFGLSGLLPSFFKLGALQSALFARLVILLGLNLGSAVPVALLGSYLCGLNRFDLFNLISILRQGVRTFLIFVLLLYGYGVLTCATCVLFSTFMAAPLSWWTIRKVDPSLKFSRRMVKLKTASELVNFSFWTLLNNAGQLLRDSTDSIVVGRVLNAALITPFAVASRMVDYFRPIITSMVSPLLPRMSQLDGRARYCEMQDLFLQMTRFSALASLAIGSMVVLHGRSLLLLWVGPKYVSSYSILVLLVVGAVASSAQLGTLSTLVAKGRHRAYGIWTMGEGLANLGLSIYWAHKYGIVGVAMGTAVPLLVVKLTLQPWYVTRVLDMSLSEYFLKALVRPVVVCGIFLGLGALTTGFQANGNVWHLLASLVWETAFLTILSYTIGISGSDKKMIQLRFPFIARLLKFS